ncbi:MAG: hypothetical protein ABIR25_03170 [Sphingomicrobium sp.]
MKRNTALVTGLVATLAATFLWHGPGGAGARFAGSIDRTMRATLDHYEMPSVAARLQRDPLTRRLMLEGPADDFQRGEIKRIALDVPGVATAHWAGPRNPPRALPLLAEAMLMALACFAIGVVLAYIAALRRRSREAFA